MSARAVADGDSPVRRCQLALAATEGADDGQACQPHLMASGGIASSIVWRRWSGQSQGGGCQFAAAEGEEAQLLAIAEAVAVSLGAGVGLSLLLKAALAQSCVTHEPTS